MGKYDDLKGHPLAGEYPLMEGAAFTELVESVKANGLEEPVSLWAADPSVILDGRNRYRALREAGVPLRDCHFALVTLPEADLPEWIRVKNLHRRHLTAREQQDRRRARVARVAGRRRRGESLRAIAEAEGVSDQQVRRDIAAATATGVAVEPESGRVAGRDGKDRPASRPPAPPSAPPAPEEPAPSGGGAAADPGPPEAADPDPPAADAAGVPLPGQAAPAFALLPDLRRLCRALDEAARETERLGRSPAGLHLHWQSVQAQLRRARASLWQARPAHVCPYCRGESPECGPCRGAGWVTVMLRNAAPAGRKGGD